MSKPKTKRFFVTFTAEIELTADILRTAKSKAWAKEFYTFTTDEQVAMFVGRLFAMGYESVDKIDGFADKVGDKSRMIDSLRAEEAAEDKQ